MSQNASEELSTELTIADLENIARIIEAGSAKGIFAAKELLTVGVLYGKIIHFLQQHEHTNTLS
jgi:hypothetical protein